MQSDRYPYPAVYEKEPDVGWKRLGFRDIDMCLNPKQNLGRQTEIGPIGDLAVGKKPAYA